MEFCLKINHITIVLSILFMIIGAVIGLGQHSYIAFFGFSILGYIIECFGLFVAICAGAITILRLLQGKVTEAIDAYNVTILFVAILVAGVFMR